MSVSWPQSGGVPRGLESYYQYVAEAADGRGTRPVTRPFIAGQATQTANITGLRHNTMYNVNVRIDASHNSQTRKGSAGGTLIVKTACICKYEHYFKCTDHLLGEVDELMPSVYNQLTTTVFITTIIMLFALFMCFLALPFPF